MSTIEMALEDNARLRRALELYRELDDAVDKCGEHAMELAPEACEKCVIPADKARCAMREALAHPATPEAVAMQERKEAAELLAQLLSGSSINQAHQTALTGPGTTYITFTFHEASPDPGLAADLRSLQARQKERRDAKEATC
jgi:hypothetical protein